MSYRSYRNRERLYTLSEGDDPTPAADVPAWGSWLKTANRVVSRTKINDETHVLTTFTGISSAGSDETPVLWETRVFGGRYADLGQRDTTIMSARVGHSLWCQVAHEELLLERVRALPQHLIDHEDSRLVSDENSLWLDDRAVCDLFNIDRKSLSNYEHLGALRPRHVKRVKRYGRGHSCHNYGDKIPVYGNVAMYDALEIVSLGRYDACNWGRRYLPQQLKPRHAEILDAYVSPVAITLVEFRVRYGYRCKQFGSRWRVTRADGTVVCSELSPQQAWKTALPLEKPRLDPILIARDAIEERRFVNARTIADQLTPDLAEPLRREIVSAESIAASKVP